MKIKFVNFPKQYQQIKQEIDTAIQDVLSRGDLILRSDVAKFEDVLSKYCGTRYAVGLNSCTDALFLSLKALGIGKGDEVITVSHTFISTIQVIVHCGAKPVLIDVKEDGLMDVDLLEQAITKKTKAIIPVHMHGKVCEMGRIMRIANRHKIPVIEDAAQAIMAKYKGQKAGSFGLTGCFSFYPAKILGCYGDAGAVITDSKKIYEWMMKARNHWKTKETARHEWAWNSRLDNLQAAILNVKMKYLIKAIERRREIAEMYRNGLTPKVAFNDPDPNCYEVYQEYFIRAFSKDERDELKEYLAKNGVEVLVQNTIPNHRRKGLRLNAFKLPITEMLSKTGLRLPIDPVLENSEIQYIIKVVNKFYASKSDDRPENLYVFQSIIKHSHYHGLKNKPILISNLI